MTTEAERFQSAVEAYQLGDFESAIREFRSLWEETGRRNYADNLAMAYLRAYQWDNAKLMFRQLMGQVPSGTTDDHVRALEGYYLANEMVADADLGFHQP